MSRPQLLGRGSERPRPNQTQLLQRISLSLFCSMQEGESETQEGEYCQTRPPRSGTLLRSAYLSGNARMSFRRIDGTGRIFTQPLWIPPGCLFRHGQVLFEFVLERLVVLAQKA